MPVQIVGRSRSISSSCMSDGVVVPEPAQLTAMPATDAERKRHMHAPAAHAAGTCVYARKPGHRELDVLEAARIEERGAGGTAGAPILGDPIRRLKAKSSIEVAIGQAAQHVLGEDRNLAPLIWVVEL